MLVGYQDLLGDGKDRVDMRPAAGGSEKLLSGPPGYSMNVVGFSAGDKAAIATGGPNGNVLQRIDVPARTAPR